LHEATFTISIEGRLLHIIRSEVNTVLLNEYHCGNSETRLTPQSAAAQARILDEKPNAEVVQLE
jgi:hypothetical protein